MPGNEKAELKKSGLIEMFSYRCMKREREAREELEKGGK